MDTREGYGARRTPPSRPSPAVGCTHPDSGFLAAFHKVPLAQNQLGGVGQREGVYLLRPNQAKLEETIMKLCGKASTVSRG